LLLGFYLFCAVFGAAMVAVGLYDALAALLKK
jgi:hypothetical protein